MKSHFPPSTLAAALVLACVLAPGDAAAAESYDNCTGFIDTIPVVIVEQGVWCLRDDLSTSLNSGTVVSIGANNVTIDCNGFKLGNLSAPTPRNATGIAASGRSNLVIRNCALRGFFRGIHLGDGYGHLIEGNTIDGVRSVGIGADGDQAVIRDNRVNDTGIDDDSGLGLAIGISAQGDRQQVYGNSVSGVYGSADLSQPAVGIFLFGHGSWVHDNHISEVVPGGSDIKGLYSTVSSQAVIERNVIVNAAGPGIGIDVSGGATAPVCRNNVVRGYTTSAYDSCIDGGGNYDD